MKQSFFSVWLLIVSIVILLFTSISFCALPEYDYFSADISIEQNKIVYNNPPNVTFNSENGKEIMYCEVYVLNLTNNTLEDVRFYIYVEYDHGVKYKIPTKLFDIYKGTSLLTCSEDIGKKCSKIDSITFSIGSGEEFELQNVADVCQDNSKVKAIIAIVMFVCILVIIVTAFNICRLYVVKSLRKRARRKFYNVKDSSVVTCDSKNPVHDSCSIENWQKNHATIRDGSKINSPREKCDYCGYVNTENSKKCALCGANLKNKK